MSHIVVCRYHYRENSKVWLPPWRRGCFPVTVWLNLRANVDHCPEFTEEQRQLIVRFVGWILHVLSSLFFGFSYLHQVCMALPLSVRTVYDESRNPFRCFTLSRSFVFEMYLYVAVRSHSIEMRNKKHRKNWVLNWTQYIHEFSTSYGAWQSDLSISSACAIESRWYSVGNSNAGFLRPVTEWL